jgi:hypothetical protein
MSDHVRSFCFIPVWSLALNADYEVTSCANGVIGTCRTLFVGKTGLEQAKQIVTSYKQGKTQQLTPEVWRAKRIVDSTLHPETGQPVFLPLRMSCFALSNLVVTAGMLTPGLGVSWQTCPLLPRQTADGACRPPAPSSGK